MDKATTTMGKRVRFRMAGYLFTYRKAAAEARVRIDMWREDEETGERHWISVAACAPNTASARSVALALVAWIRSLDVGIKRDAKAQAVAESFALLRDRLALMAPGAHASMRARSMAPSLHVASASKPLGSECAA